MKHECGCKVEVVRNKGSYWKECGVHSAAHDLLAACEHALKRIEKLNVGTEELGDDPTITELKAAIKKAKKK